MGEVNYKKIIEGLRWKEDMLVTNDFGERVWLRSLFFNGKRIGITDCCFEDNPCHRHSRTKAELEAEGEH